MFREVVAGDAALSREQLSWIFHYIDVDQSGLVSLQELAEVLDDLQELSPSVSLHELSLQELSPAHSLDGLSETSPAVSLQELGLPDLDGLAQVSPTKAGEPPRRCR